MLVLAAFYSGSVKDADLALFALQGILRVSLLLHQRISPLS